ISGAVTDKNGSEQLAVWVAQYGGLRRFDAFRPLLNHAVKHQSVLGAQAPQLQRVFRAHDDHQGTRLEIANGAQDLVPVRSAIRTMQFGKPGDWRRTERSVDVIEIEFAGDVGLLKIVLRLELLGIYPDQPRALQELEFEYETGKEELVQVALVEF